MPIYDFICRKCGRKLETIQGISVGVPLCCGKAMNRLLTSPSLIRITGKGGTRTHTRGYKEGYAKDYQKDVPPHIPKT